MICINNCVIITMAPISLDFSWADPPGDPAAEQQGPEDHPECFGQASSRELSGKSSVFKQFGILILYYIFTTWWHFDQKLKPTLSQENVKHFIPHHAITCAVQGSSPNEDVVSTILLIYNPATACPVHVHSYRCDSPETAQLLQEQLQVEDCIKI